MARIPTSGPFSMSDINAEWQLGYSLGVHRGQRTDAGFLPSAPNPISYSDFRGRAKAFVLDITISSWQAAVNYRSWAVAYGWDQVVPLTMTIRNNSVIFANDTGWYALDTDQDFPSGSVLNFINNDIHNPDGIGNGVGIVAGRGGNGGRGGGGGGAGPDGSSGNHGGPAIFARHPINIWNYGAIGGGGGGGGGGAGSYGWNSSGGSGGGGGGFGYGAGQNWDGVTLGRVGGSGGDGSWYAQGNGGSSGNGYTGLGGNGGQLGQNGSDGSQVGPACCDYRGPGSPGAGGIAGRAVVGGNVNWQYYGHVFDGNSAPFFYSNGDLGTYNKNQYVAMTISAYDHHGDLINSFDSPDAGMYGLSISTDYPLGGGTATLSGTLPDIGDTSVSEQTHYFTINVYDDRGAGRGQGFWIRVLNPDYVPSGGGSDPGGGGYVSCFPGDALVLMANGLLKRIDEIHPGDLVVGGRGEINEVIALDPSPLGDRDLYTINGHHRTTSEHRHWTTEGWASLSPTATWSEHEVEYPVIYADGIRKRKMLKFVNGTPLGTLKMGMTFDTIRGPVPFETLTSAKHSNMTVHSLVVGGSHTFIVNGYTVSGWATDMDFDYKTWTPRTSGESE